MIPDYQGKCQKKIEFWLKKKDEVVKLILLFINSFLLIATVTTLSVMTTASNHFELLVASFITLFVMAVAKNHSECGGTILVSLL